jgi:hypothetical protein
MDPAIAMLPFPDPWARSLSHLPVPPTPRPPLLDWLQCGACCCSPAGGSSPTLPHTGAQQRPGCRLLYLRGPRLCSHGRFHMQTGCRRRVFAITPITPRGIRHLQRGMMVCNRNLITGGPLGCQGATPRHHPHQGRAQAAVRNAWPCLHTLRPYHTLCRDCQWGWVRRDCHHPTDLAHPFRSWSDQQVSAGVVRHVPHD